MVRQENLGPGPEGCYSVRILRNISRAPCVPDVTFGCKVSESGFARLWSQGGCRASFLMGRDWHFDCHAQTSLSPATCANAGIDTSGLASLPPGAHAIYTLPAHGFGDRLLALIALATWRQLHINAGGRALQIEVHWPSVDEHRCCWGCAPNSCDIRQLLPLFSRTSLETNGLHLFHGDRAKDQRLSSGNGAVLHLRDAMTTATPQMLAEWTGRPLSEAESLYRSIARGFVQPSVELRAQLDRQLPQAYSFTAVHIRRGDKIVEWWQGLDTSHRIRPRDLGKLDESTWQLIEQHCAKGKVLLVGDNATVLDEYATRLGPRAFRSPSAEATEQPKDGSHRRRRSESEEFSLVMRLGGGWRGWNATAGREVGEPRSDLANRTVPNTQQQLMLDFFSIARARTVVISMRFSAFSTAAALVGGGKIVYALGSSKQVGNLAAFLTSKTGS